MLEGKCLILFMETMTFYEEDGDTIVFSNEKEAREFAEDQQIEGYEIVGLLDYQEEWHE